MDHLREQDRIQRHEQKALADGEQNRASRHIARQKHDAQKQPRARK